VILEQRDPVVGIAFSPDDTLLATSGGQYGEYGEVKLWDVSSGKLLCTLSGHTDQVWGITFSPDGDLLASGGLDGTIRLWDVSARRERQTLTPGAQVGDSFLVASTAFSPDGRQLAIGGGHWTHGEIKVYDGANFRQVVALDGGDELNWPVVFSPDGKYLAAGDSAGVLRVWDTTYEHPPLVLTSSAGGGLAFSDDGQTLASAGQAKTVSLWDVPSGQQIGTLPVPHWTTSLAFTPDGNALVAADSSGIVTIWRTPSANTAIPLTESFEINGHSSK
jgi:WD40 repeat protein